MKTGLEGCLHGAVGELKCVACGHDENEMLSDRGSRNPGVELIAHIQ